MAQHKTARKAGGKIRISTRSMKKAKPTRPAKSGSTKRSVASAAAVVPGSAGDEEVPIDRRRAERRGEVAASAIKLAGPALQLERRKKVNRRRQIDPTTCERDYTDQEVEFMNALDDYKRKSGRMFPTCSEVLEVLHALGYVKLTAAELGSRPDDSASEASAKPMPGDWQGTATGPTFSDDRMAAAEEPELAY